MNSPLWAQLHGAVTHFPIALLIASVLFDITGQLINRQPVSRDLHMAGFYALLLGALASFAAVLTGLLLTSWEVFGTGLLEKHHRFIWPAFSLMIGLAVWRLYVRERASRKSFAIYLGIALLAAVLMGTAGYWGGAMILGFWV